jgi:glycosyltransferase involved in cell wall biosynthesis
MVSFVIPAFNEALLLGRTLCALNEAARALGQPFEVVVSDDGPPDQTAAVARKQGAPAKSSCLLTLIRSLPRRVSARRWRQCSRRGVFIDQFGFNERGS